MRQTGRDPVVALVWESKPGQVSPTSPHVKFDGVAAANDEGVAVSSWDRLLGGTQRLP